MHLIIQQHRVQTRSEVIFDQEVIQIGGQIS
jgi:hypothetical protein